MAYTRRMFEQDWACYCDGFLFATKDEADEYACGVMEAQADWEAEQAVERYFENRGWEEAQAERAWEDARGVIQFDDAMRMAGL